MLKLSMDRIEALLMRLAESGPLYLPLEKAGQVIFGRWAAGETVRFDALKTVKSAKDFFFPQSENLAAFKMEGKTIEILEAERAADPFVLMGVRACDVKSFEILDRVFLSEPADTFYQARRERGVVVSLACEAPALSCFCAAFGIDAAEPAGDVATWIAEGDLYWKPVTEKGERLTERVRDLFVEDDGRAAEAQKAATREKVRDLPFAGLNLAGFGKDELMEKFHSPRWKSLSACCVGCGTCTFVCPTCQCYDIRDFDAGCGVQRTRCWDSCMYSDFTLMAHGTNRPTQLEKFRQRFMHKLVYFPSNNDGLYSCVGCGRCVEKCPIHMNIVKVARALGEGEKA